MNRLRALVALALLLQTTFGSDGVAFALTFTVDRTDDVSDASAQVCSTLANDCSLRGAILRTNADPAADTIIVPAGTYQLTIPLSAAVTCFDSAGNPFEENATAGSLCTQFGDLDIMESLTIAGAGPGITIIEGGSGFDDRLIHVSNVLDGSLTVSGLTLRAGNTGFRGGAIYVPGSTALTATNVEIVDNTATNAGGAIAVQGTGPMRIDRALIAGNATGGRGGALFVDIAEAYITNTTISGNTAQGDKGGAAFLFTAAPFVLAHCTVVDNVLQDPNGSGGGIHVDDPGSLLALRDNIFARNVIEPGGIDKAENCGGGNPVFSLGYNFFDDDTCGPSATDQLVSSSALSASLGDNGFPGLRTHDIEDAAPVDAIPVASCLDADGQPLGRDQRDFSRPAQSDGSADFCDAGALEVGCGDGVVRFDEQCDDGNGDNTDSCTARCAPPACGDGFLQGGESCDDGNTADGDGCSAGCADEGAPACGDGILQAGEACDDGDGNSDTKADACRTDCTAPVCGDGAQDSGEECDDGPGNSDDGADSCRTDCTVASCGDGVLDSGEQCDDGNFESSDACLGNCTVAACGDGLLHVGVEQCDDGNTSDDDACLTTCVVATCGDGFTCSDADSCTTGPGGGTEECDDQNGVDTDSCLNSCAIATCGDGTVQAGVEDCDDGNLIGTDLCRFCKHAVCGDGVLLDPVLFVDADGHPLEECDDGNADNTDDCLNTCRVAFCGDAYTHASLEECDDGNSVPCDGCGIDCVKTVDLTSAVAIPFFPECGNGVVDHICEQCDDGNNVSGDGCGFNCFSERDRDGDRVPDGADNCVARANADQANYDKDAFGDACDIDDDNDRIIDVIETGTRIFRSAIDTGSDPFDVDSDDDRFGDHLELRNGSDLNDRGDFPVLDPLSRDEQACVNGLGKRGSEVAKEQGKVIRECVESAGKGRLSAGAQACLGDDARGRVARARQKTVDAEARWCGDVSPAFGTTDAGAVNAAAVRGEVDLLHDVFGPDLDAAILTDATGRRCQDAVIKNYEKAVQAMSKEFGACKKRALRGGAADPVTLENCVGADGKGRVAKTVMALSSDVSRKCTLDLDAAFPGRCAGATDFAACVADRVDCRVCLTLNAMDDLIKDCDAFDDGLANDSCPP